MDFCILPQVRGGGHRHGSYRQSRAVCWLAYNDDLNKYIHGLHRSYDRSLHRFHDQQMGEITLSLFMVRYFENTASDSLCLYLFIYFLLISSTMLDHTHPFIHTHTHTHFVAPAKTAAPTCSALWFSVEVFPFPPSLWCKTVGAQVWQRAYVSVFDRVTQWARKRFYNWGNASGRLGIMTNLPQNGSALAIYYNAG